MKRIMIILAALILIMGMTACGKKKVEAKNMEQIQKEQGIPVRVTEITTQPFVKEVVYNAPLMGVEESIARSMVSDVVANVTAKVGDYVKKDQVIITFPEDTPSAQYIQASSAYQNTKTTYERMQRLYNQGAISQQDMDNVTTAYNVAKANLNTSSKLIRVTSPISGYITAMNVSPTDKVNPGDALFTVSNTSKYKAIIWVPDTEIQYVKKGQKATAQWTDQTLTGRISTVSMAMDQDKKAFRAEVLFDTHPKQIAVGVTVEIRLEVSRINNAIVIPRAALVQQTDSTFVWLAKDNKAVKTAVTTGQDNGLEYEIKSGLTTGDKLITEGISLLTDNCRIQIIP